MLKQNGRFSKIVPKPSVFVGFLDIWSCQPKQTRDMQRIEKSPKIMSKNQLFFCRNSIYFRSFLASISKSEICTSWGKSWARFWPRFPTMLGSKTTSERHQKIITKKGASISPTWAPTWPQEASRIGAMDRRNGRRIGPRCVLTTFMPNKPSWTPFWHHVARCVNRFWIVLGPSLS